MKCFRNYLLLLVSIAVSSGAGGAFAGDKVSDNATLQITVHPGDSNHFSATCGNSLANCLVTLHSTGGGPNTGFVEVFNNSSVNAQNVRIRSESIALLTSWGVTTDNTVCGSTLEVGAKCRFPFRVADFASTQSPATFAISGYNTNIIFFNMEIQD